MTINKPIPFIKAIKLGSIVAPGLSKLGQKVLENPKNINVSRRYGLINRLIEKQTL